MIWPYCGDCTSKSLCINAAASSSVALVPLTYLAMILAGVMMFATFFRLSKLLNISTSDSSTLAGFPVGVSITLGSLSGVTFVAMMSLMYSSAVEDNVGMGVLEDLPERASRGVGPAAGAE